MKKYKISLDAVTDAQKGIWRSKASDYTVAHDSWEKFKMRRSVEYTEADVARYPLPTDNHYIFRLPAEARPFKLVAFKDWLVDVIE